MRSPTRGTIGELSRLMQRGDRAERRRNARLMLKDRISHNRRSAGAGLRRTSKRWQRLRRLVKR